MSVYAPHTLSKKGSAWPSLAQPSRVPVVPIVCVSLLVCLVFFLQLSILPRVCPLPCWIQQGEGAGGGLRN
jgi:hypothetical protein